MHREAQLLNMAAKQKMVEMNPRDWDVLNGALQRLKNQCRHMENWLAERHTSNDIPPCLEKYLCFADHKPAPCLQQPARVTQRL